MKIIRYNTIDSTFTRAGAYDGEDGEVLFLAREQTAGRGQYDHRFESANDNGIYATLLIRNRAGIVPAELLPCVTPMCAVCVSEIIDSVTAYGDRLSVRWINDLLLDGRKYGGILTACEIHEGKVVEIRVGYGINTGEAELPQEKCGNAVSLRIGSARNDDIAEAIARKILVELPRCGGEEIFARYAALIARCPSAFYFQGKRLENPGLLRDYALCADCCGTRTVFRSTHELTYE